MTSWNPYEPCSVGDLRLPAQFQPVIWWFYADTKSGHPTRMWLHLPAGMIISLNCETDASSEIEIWRFGSLTLTRPMTEDEREDWRCDQYDPSDW